MHSYYPFPHYIDSVDTDVDKKVSRLDVKIKKIGPNSTSVTSDHYAAAMVQYVKDVRKLMKLGLEGAKHAFVRI